MRFRRLLPVRHQNQPYECVGRLRALPRSQMLRQFEGRRGAQHAQCAVSIDNCLAGSAQWCVRVRREECRTTSDRHRSIHKWLAVGLQRRIRLGDRHEFPRTVHIAAGSCLGLRQQTSA